MSNTCGMLSFDKAGLIPGLGLEVTDHLRVSGVRALCRSEGVEPTVRRIRSVGTGLLAEAAALGVSFFPSDAGGLSPSLMLLSDEKLQGTWRNVRRSDPSSHGSFLPVKLTGVIGFRPMVPSKARLFRPESLAMVVLAALVFRDGPATRLLGLRRTLSEFGT